MIVVLASCFITESFGRVDSAVLFLIRRASEKAVQTVREQSPDEATYPDRDVLQAETHDVFALFTSDFILLIGDVLGKARAAANASIAKLVVMNFFHAAL